MPPFWPAAPGTVPSPTEVHPARNRAKVDPGSHCIHACSTNLTALDLRYYPLPSSSGSNKRCCLFDEGTISNQDPLDLIEGYLVLASVIQAGRPRAFVVGHRLSNLQFPAISQIPSDTRCPKGGSHIGPGVRTRQGLGKLHRGPHAEGEGKDLDWRRATEGKVRKRIGVVALAVHALPREGRCASAVDAIRQRTKATRPWRSLQSTQ